MKKLSLLFPALALAGLVTAQSHKFEWVHGTGSSGAENTHSVATDKDGNIYTSGRFRNSFDFDPGPGTSTLTAVSTYYDIFVSKFDKDGNFVWVKQLGGSGVKTDAYLTLDTANNIYLAGAFNGKIDLDPGAGIFEMTADTTQEMFVAKYNQDGDFIWAKQMGGYNSYSTPKAIATDDFGNVYTTGTFIDTVDFDPGAGLFPLHTAGGQDFYISKLDKDGGFVWAKSCGYADSITTSFSIAADGLGNTYTVGSFTGIVDFDPGAGVSELSAVRPQTFILKLDIAGDFAWARQVENKSSAPRPSNTSRSVIIDKSGDVYVAGNFMGAADFDPGVAEEVMTADSLDAYVLKLSKDGDFAWAKQVGGFAQDFVACIRTDESENSYLAGTFLETGDFDPGPGQFMLQSAGMQDMFIVKLDKSGSFVWAKSMGGTEQDALVMIALDKEENLYSAGDFRGTADFNPGTGMASVLSNGSSDLFLQKMIPCTPSTGDTIKTGFCASYTLNGITYTKAGIYTQMLSNSEGCDSVVTLQLTSAPIIDMTVIKTADTLKAATAGKTYQWVECPSMDFVPGATGQSFAPAKSGSYAVIVYVHPCRYTSACTNVTRLGIDEAETSIKAVVYPSPAKDIVTVSTKENLKQASLSIINLHGQLVLSEENVSGNRIELDLSGQASGVYFLKIVSEGRASEVMKIIKE